jgi:hypothetical protein
MRDLRYTLISDGGSDRALLPIIRWTLIESGSSVPWVEQWADFGLIRRPPATLVDKIELASQLWPCDLFVHRDAERSSLASRRGEIRRAAAAVPTAPPVVCIIPIRMMEAWLLLDEQAIREASGNPRGSVALNLPSPARIEQLPDPKRILHESLLTASELPGRRRAKFSLHAAVRQLSGLSESFAALRSLPAFVEFKTELRAALTRLPAAFGA